MKSKRRSIGLFLVALGLGLAVGNTAHAIIGRPLTPFSFAGVARRSVRRSAYWGAAALPRAAVPVLPAGCVVGVACAGGAVYRPYYAGPNVMYVP